jgi:hypothetical protein
VLSAPASATCSPHRRIDPRDRADLAEAQEYGIAATEAMQEAQFTKVSTAIQGFQQERELSQSLGQTTADVAGAGFATSGSALDLLRSSASQGATQQAVTQQAVTQQQGLVTEQGYEEQAQSYLNMESAADMAASAEKKAATGAEIGAGFQFAAGVASLFAGGAGGGGASPPGGAGSGGFYGGAVEG